MRIIIGFFLILALAVSFKTWKTSLDTRFINSCIEEANKELDKTAQELNRLETCKEEEGAFLEELYLEVFGQIQEISSYYHADSKVSIAEAKNLVNTREFFRPSDYKGVNFLDLQVRVDLKSQPDKHLISLLSNMAGSRPVEILEINLEKDILSLIMRLYGT